MNSTPRWLNRLILVVVGAVLMALGAMTVLLGAVPGLRDEWSRSAPHVLETLEGPWKATAITGLRHSWLSVAVVVVAAALVVLAVVICTRQGRGRTGLLLRAPGAEGAPEGAVVVDAAIAQQAIVEAVSTAPEVLSAQVSGYRAPGGTAVKVTVTARRGASPDRILAHVQAAVEGWDQVFGTELPVLIEIGGGFRSRVSRVVRTREPAPR